MRQQRLTAVIGGTAPVLALALLGQAGPASAGAVSGGAADAGCTPSVVALPLPSGTTSGSVLSATDRMAVGAVADDAQHQTVAVWRRIGEHWTVRDLGDFGISEPQEPLSATGVNAYGEVSIGVNADVMGAWVARNGVVRRLKDFAGGTHAYARAINDNGEVVGEALDAKGGDYGAVWRRGSSRPTRLSPTAGYDGSFAQGVNDRGQVVGGSFSNGPAPTIPIRWSPGGRLTRLDTLGADAQAFDINNAGRAVGEASNRSGQSEAVVWYPGGGVRGLGIFAGSEFSRAYGVNASGLVAGFEGVNPPPPAIPVRHVLLWPGHGPARTLLPLSGHWADGALSLAVDNQGDVFGASSASSTSIPQPTEWTCALRQSFVPPAAG